MEFELIEDVEGERKTIERAIESYGTDPEQNYGYFRSHETGSNKCVYMRNGKYGILTTYNRQSKNWVMIGTPIAPKSEQTSVLLSGLDFLSEKGKLGKFTAEFDAPGRKELTEAAGKYHIHTPNCVLYWPVYDMATWTGEKLEGGEWKKLRNVINRLRRNHRIEVVDSVEIDKSKLTAVIDQWARHRDQNGFGVNRKNSNRTDDDEYRRFVELGFLGCKSAKTVLVDGRPASITAGWEIPNSNGAYYSGVGVYDTSVPGLGEFANWSDLVMLKNASYREVDFGGSPKPLLQFKQKFKPSRLYTTYIFSITRT